MASTRILIQLEHPSPEETVQAPEPVSIEDKVRDAIECLDSGYKSDIEWIMLNRIYGELINMRSNSRIENLKNMIEPVLAKYGYHKVTNGGK
jgi:hypothetical protein